MEINENPLIFKLVLVGDSSVGKSTILAKFLDDKFENNYKTEFFQFCSKIIDFKNKKIKIQIWKIFSKENFRLISSSYFSGALGAIIVYDISKKSSFRYIDDWIRDLKEYGNKNIIINLIGNKSDLNDKREISKEEGKNLAKKNNLNFMEISELNDENINIIFNEIIDKIYRNNVFEFYNEKEILDAPPPTPTPQFPKKEIDIFFSCPECSSPIEIILIDEINNNIKFKCLNKKSHGIKYMSIKSFFEKIKESKKKNEDEYKIHCKKHISYQNNNYVTFCLDCNIHLCKECLKTRIHLNHKKNNIIEIQPIEDELIIIDNVIEDYKIKLKNLKEDKKNKTDELDNKLENEKKNEEKILIKNNKIIKEKEEEELKSNKEKYFKDINKLKKEFEEKVKERKKKFKIDNCMIYKNFKLKYQKEKIHFENKIEQLIKKHDEDFKSYQFEKKIENMENLIKLNELIFNIYNNYNDNYYNSLNINNLLFNYCDNQYISNNLMKKVCKDKYEEIYKIIKQIKEEQNKSNNIIVHELEFSELKEEINHFFIYFFL